MITENDVLTLTKEINSMKTIALGSVTCGCIVWIFGIFCIGFIGTIIAMLLPIDETVKGYIALACFFTAFFGFCISIIVLMVSETKYSNARKKETKEVLAKLNNSMFAPRGLKASMSPYSSYLMIEIVGGGGFNGMPMM